VTPITNLNRIDANSNGTALSSGVLTAVAIKLSAGATIKNITFVTGTTAAGTPTHWGFNVYDTQATPALLGSTADQTTGAMAANTAIMKALATPVVVKKAGWYRIGIWVVATTVPTLLSAPAIAAGLLTATGLQAGDVPLAVTAGSGLTTAGPATLTGAATALVVPYVAVS
jgi:hypothetical protein